LLGGNVRTVKRRRKSKRGAMARVEE